MKLEEIESTRKEIELLRKDLFNYQTRVNSAILQTHKWLELLSKEEVKIKADSADWSYILEEVDTTARYNLCQKSLEKYGLGSFGYWPEINQRAIQIYINESTDYEKIITGLEIILPFVKPQTTPYFDSSNKLIMICILDQDCSEHGIPRLLIKPDFSEYYFGMEVHHRASIHKEFSTLKETIDWLRKNR